MQSKIYEIMQNVSYELSQIRSAFIDAQNNANFSIASKSLAKLFAGLLPYSGNEGSYSIKLWSSRKKVVFKIAFDGKEYLIVLKKEGMNYAAKNDESKLKNELNGVKITDVVDIKNSEIAFEAIKLIGALFTGEGFYIIDEALAKPKLNEDLLSTYAPKDEMFTSKEEIRYVNENLIEGKKLESLGFNDLRETRNMVVDYFSKNDRESRLERMSSLQSLTAIIDFFIFKK